MILDINHCYSNADGEVIGKIVRSALQEVRKSRSLFEEIDSVSSSFVNTAFIDLLEHYNFEFIKSQLSFVRSNSKINDLIKRRFQFEGNERKFITT